MGIGLETIEFYDNGGGLDLKSSPTKVAEDSASLSLNIDYSTDGAFRTRYGSTIQNIAAGIPSQMSGAPRTVGLFDYHKSDGTEVIVVATDDGKIKHGLTTPTDQVTGLTTGLIPDFEFCETSWDEFLVFGNGTDTNLKFDGTSWVNLSLPRPAAPTLTEINIGTGNLPAGDYYFYYSYAVTSGGIIVEEGELSPISSVLNIGVGPSNIRVTVANSADTQVNAKVIYVLNNTSGEVVRVVDGAAITDNTTTTYDFSIVDASLSTIQADFDLQAAPVSGIFETDDYGHTFYVDGADKRYVYPSRAYLPWAAPTTGGLLLDGPIQCIKRCFGVLIFGTDRSLWVLNGNIDSGALPRRFSSSIGILNNRCAVGKDSLYILGTNYRFYRITPTDFSQDQMRISDPLSLLVDTLFSDITQASLSHVCMEYYNLANLSKIMVCCPLGISTNNAIIIFNEAQSLKKGQTVWQLNDNINASAIKQMTVSGNLGLYSGDYNGFLWKLDDTSMYGDGAEENGTVTSATNTTLSDSTATWTVNGFVGVKVRIIDGPGVDQERTIVSNTGTQITVDSAWTTNPTSASSYTIGGYDVYHYTNWKKVLNSYDVLKQLWFIMANANASGDYPISIVIQADFNQNTNQQASINFSLVSLNAIWGSFIWGDAIWGSQSVFQSRYRFYSRFRALRLGFINRLAGQPFQINGYSLSAQDKKLIYRGTT